MVGKSIFILVALCVPFVGLECRNWTDFALVTCYAYINIFVFWLFVTKLARGNFLAYFLFFALGLALTYLKALLVNQTSLFVSESLLLSVLLLTPLIVAGWLWFSEGTELKDRPKMVS